jgi:hypothetical protein
LPTTASQTCTCMCCHRTHTWPVLAVRPVLLVLQRADSTFAPTPGRLVCWCWACARDSSPSGGSSRRASCLQVGRLHHLCCRAATPSFPTGFEARHVVTVSTIGRSHLLQSPLLLPVALLVSLSSPLTLSKLSSYAFLLLLPSPCLPDSSCRDA